MIPNELPNLYCFPWFTGEKCRLCSSVCLFSPPIMVLMASAPWAEAIANLTSTQAAIQSSHGCRVTGSGACRSCDVSPPHSHSTHLQPPFQCPSWKETICSLYIHPVLSTVAEAFLHWAFSQPPGPINIPSQQRVTGWTPSTATSLKANARFASASYMFLAFTQPVCFKWRHGWLKAVRVNKNATSRLKIYSSVHDRGGTARLSECYWNLN